MPPALPLITLLTDFGTKDHFVASMKGVILTINPDVRVIDISHEIPPHRIADAAHCLQACYRTFPEGTVHVVVVDPGVGSARRPILVKTARYYFVAPDNGVLTPTLKEEPDIEIRQLENRWFQLEAPGATFHGRDIFAPAAAWLTKHQAFDSFGQPIRNPVLLPPDEPFWRGSALVGKVVAIDRFGNLISNIPANVFENAQPGRGQQLSEIRLGASPVDGLVKSYSEGAVSRPCALINSNGYVEIFLKEKSAAEVLKVGVGTVVTLT